MATPESPLKEDSLPKPDGALESGTRRRLPDLEGFSLKSKTATERLVSNRYKVEGSLGEGGTATVYLARDTHTEQLVVIKQMKDEVATSPELRRRFLLEARALACVDHPAVIRVLDIEEPPIEAPFLALEALRGETLGDYLKREGLLSIALATRLFQEAALALEAVHEAGIVHRDIKPDNLYLVGKVGEPTSIKVLDFGMARLSDEGHDEGSTSILGTAQYMAPEQILVEPVDARTDIYSLGVVLFRALTGHLPFEAGSKNDLLRHQLFSPVPPVNWLNDALPLEMELIVHKSTRKAPDERFQTMQEFFLALDELNDRSPIESNDSAEPEESGELRISIGSTPKTTPPPALVEAPDIYRPISQRGKKVATVLATQFGVYSRPHNPSPSSNTDPDQE